MLGAGIQGCCVALALAREGHAVDLVDRRPQPMAGTSLHTEGKIHLGFVYAKDPSLETHRSMIRGSLGFADGLRTIAGIEPGRYARGIRFHYVVPNESRLDAASIETHFERVASEISAARQTTANDYLGRPISRPFHRLSPAQWSGTFSPDAVQAVFETEEEAVDTLQLASLLRRAITEQSRIRFLGDTRASGADIVGERRVCLQLERAGGRVQRRYRAAFNCLWAGRLALDAKLGLRPERPWLFRFKALVRLDAPEMSCDAIPSATLVHGPFGDIVNYGHGRYYLSWYPSFKLAETTDLDGVPLAGTIDRFDEPERQRLARGGVEAMARYLPAVETLLETRRPFEVGGGVIFSWGSTDIDDPSSGLHQRWRIGPRRHGPYVSIDTGKYTMAPVFALEARELLKEMLA